jgi:hypothetical protein
MIRFHVDVFFFSFLPRPPFDDSHKVVTAAAAAIGIWEKDFYFLVRARPPTHAVTRNKFLANKANDARSSECEFHGGGKKKIFLTYAYRFLRTHPREEN